MWAKILHVFSDDLLHGFLVVWFLDLASFRSRNHSLNIKLVLLQFLAPSHCKLPFDFGECVIDVLRRHRIHAVLGCDLRANLYAAVIGEPKCSWYGHTRAELRAGLVVREACRHRRAVAVGVIEAELQIHGVVFCCKVETCGPYCGP